MFSDIDGGNTGLNLPPNRVYSAQMYQTYVYQTLYGIGNFIFFDMLVVCISS